MTHDLHAFTGPRPPHDGGQGTVRGALVGCGPLSAACLLRWHADRLDRPLPPRDALAAELLTAQRAFIVPATGGQRAVLPWDWLTGTNDWLRAQGLPLRAQGLPLRARGLWGVRRAEALQRHLHRLFTAGTPAVGLEFSPRLQHYGLLSTYQPGPTLRATLLVDGSDLHLAPRVGLGGVFWIEEG
ncbi:hypothetical protein GCM10017784_31240 [Deinococcus indicus]|uniref:hypothetical protein n=1 Tax=Deinococcus indicus TaxID=223556 RepID=UPI0017484F93|nr:hypothetical protein [Deinococcus indicus]GHG35092.1 hypothetical protein GCM10017784_31240 [Deinococcus indicus]